MELESEAARKAHFEELRTSLLTPSPDQNPDISIDVSFERQNSVLAATSARKYWREWEPLRRGSDVRWAGALLIYVYVSTLACAYAKTTESQPFYDFDFDRTLTRSFARLQAFGGAVIILFAYFILQAHEWIPRKPAVLWMPMIGLFIVELLGSFSSNNVLEGSSSVMTYAALYLLWHAPFEMEPQHGRKVLTYNRFRQICCVLHLATTIWTLTLDASREYGQHSSGQGVWLYASSLCEEIVLFEILHLAFRADKGPTTLDDTRERMLSRAPSATADPALVSPERRRAQLTFGVGLFLFYASSIITLVTRWELTWDTRYAHFRPEGLSPFQAGYQFDYRIPQVKAAGYVQLIISMSIFFVALWTVRKNWVHIKPATRRLHDTYHHGLIFLVFSLLFTVELLITVANFKPGACLQLAINFFAYSSVFLCWSGGTTSALTKLARILHLVFLAIVVSIGARAFLSNEHARCTKRQQSLLFLNFIFEQMLVFELLHKAEHID